MDILESKIWMQNRKWHSKWLLTRCPAGWSAILESKICLPTRTWCRPKVSHTLPQAAKCYSAGFTGFCTTVEGISLEQNLLSASWWRAASSLWSCLSDLGLSGLWSFWSWVFWVYLVFGVSSLWSIWSFWPGVFLVASFSSLWSIWSFWPGFFLVAGCSTF